MKEVCVKDDMIDFYALEHNDREDLLAYGFKIYEIEDRYIGLCEARDFDENGFNKELYEARQQRNINYFRIEELKQNLKDTDYKSLQHHEGEITDEEFAPIKAQRKEWRAEINRLQEELNNGNNGQ